jgi:hypothetical protein
MTTVSARTTVAAVTKAAPDDGRGAGEQHNPPRSPRFPHHRRLQDIHGGATIMGTVDGKGKRSRVSGANRLGQIERLLDERGRELGPIRVAAGPSGVAVGFPRDPFVHVSWFALAALAGAVVAMRLQRAR